MLSTGYEAGSLLHRVLGNEPKILRLFSYYTYTPDLFTNRAVMPAKTELGMKKMSAALKTRQSGAKSAEIRLLEKCRLQLPT